MRGWSREKAAAYASGRKHSRADETVAALIRIEKRILELGCGPAVAARRIHPELMVCTDVTEAFLPVARVNAPASTVLCADATAIPFKNGSFDTVLAMAVLHHLEPDDLRSTLEESIRVLVPRGRFMLLEDWAFTDPSPFEQRALEVRFRNGNNEFHRSFSEWDRVFQDSGFMVLERRWPHRPFHDLGEGGSVRMMAALYGKEQ